MNYKELSEFSYECKIRPDYLFQELMIPRNQKNYETNELIKKIENHIKSRTLMPVTISNFKEMLVKLKSETSSIAKEINDNNSLMSISDMVKKFNLKESTLYGIFRKYPNYAMLPCQRRPDGMRAYDLYQIKDAFEIAIRENIVPSKREIIKKVYEDLPNFSNLKPKINIHQPDLFSETKQTESLIELQKETNNLLKQLLEIWRK